MRNKVTVKNEEDLFGLYKTWEQQRIDRTVSKFRQMGQEVSDLEPDPYLDWLIGRGICPHALVSANSKYHFETVAILDTEFGVNMPDPAIPIGDVPFLFFQSMNIVREQRRLVKEETNAKNNNH